MDCSKACDVKDYEKLKKLVDGSKKTIEKKQIPLLDY